MAARILIVSPTDSRSGAGVFRHALALGLRRAGYAVMLAQPEEHGVLQGEEQALGIEHHFFARSPYEDIDAFASDQALADGELERAAPDLVIFSSGVSPACHDSFFAAVERAGPPYIIVEHQVTRALFTFDRGRAARFSEFYRKATAVIAVSGENLRVLREVLALPEAVGQVVHCGRPDEFFCPRDPARRADLRRQWNVPDAALVVMTVAKLEPVKGHRLLIEALRRLKGDPVRDRLFLVWVGDGDQRQRLEAAIVGAGVADRIRLLGQCSEVAPLLDGGDVMALTSLSEGMPLTVMEAMAKGLPPICTDVGGTAEAIGDAGIVLPAPASGRTVAELAAAWRRLSADPDHLERLSAQARQRAAALFREDRMIEQYLDLVRRGLRRPRPQRGAGEPAAGATLAAGRESLALRINLINLDRSPDRLDNFMAINRHLGGVGRWSAVDGNALDPDAMVERGAIDRHVAANYSRGGLGNALSHIGLWERVIQLAQPLTISEDDAIYHRDFKAHATAVLKKLPADCDIILWGWNFDSWLSFAMLPGVSPCLASFDQEALRAGLATFPTQPLLPQPFRLYAAFGILCYTIFPAGAAALKKACVPLRGDRFHFPVLRREILHYALDVAMAAAYPQINAYVCFPPIVVSENDHTSSLTVTPSSGRRRR